jgi:hypothetical protein
MYSEFLCAPEEEERFTGDATFEIIHEPGDPPDSVRLKAISVTPESCLRQAGTEARIASGPGDLFTVTAPRASFATVREFWRSLRSYNLRDRYARHRFYQGEIAPAASDLDRQDATFRLTPGLADDAVADLVSFESWNYPGYFLVEENRRIFLRQRRTCSDAFNESATFRIVPGLADGSAISLESHARADHYIRHWNFQLYVDPRESGIFAEDATFDLVSPQYDPAPHYCSLRLADSDDYLVHEKNGDDLVGSVRRLFSRDDEIAASFRKMAGLGRPDDPSCVSYEALVPHDAGGGATAMRSYAQRYMRHYEYRIQISPRRPLNLRDLPEPAAVQPERVDEDGIMEYFLVKYDWGAIAYIGSYTGTQSVAYDFVRHFFEELEARDGVAILGDVWTGELNRYISEQFPAIEARWGHWFAAAIYEHVHKMMLFGDPSLRIGGARGF